MKKLFLLVALTVVAITAFWVGRSLTAPPAASLLPSQTLVLVHVPDFPRAMRQWQTTAAHTACKQPEVREFLQQSFGAPLGRMQTPLTNSALLDELRALLRGEVFFAVTHFSPVVPNRPGMVLAADTRWQRWRAQVACATVERRLRKQNPTLQIQQRQFLGARYSMWERPNDVPVCYGFLRSWFIVTLGEDVYRETISRHLRPDRYTTLDQFPDYATFHRQVPATVAAYVYVNPQPLTTLLGHAQLFAGTRTTDFRTVQAIKSIGVSVSFHGGRVHERRITTYRPEGFQPPPLISRRTLRFTSPDTIWYRAAAMDIARAYTTLSSLIVQLGFPEPTAVIETFERYLRRANVHWTDEILSRLGPETAWLVNWQRGRELPDLAWLAEVREPDRIRSPLEFALRTLGILITEQAKLPAIWDETRHDEHTFHSLIIGDGKFSPAFVVTDEFLLLASTRDFARELLTRSRRAATTLADDSTFRAATASLPLQSTKFSYLHLAELYPHLRAFFRAWSSELPIPTPMLPPAESLVPFLTPVVSITTPADNAQLTDVYSPFGSPFLWILGWVTRWAIEQGKLFPTASTTFSDTVPVFPPPENQTAESQTPPPQFVSPPPPLH
ncbi:MAG: DUF3352 domain-containing protein, partial [Verrucomicrobiae bacterium]|nr:DUF3352 domain-containing protein [Verrucomicrobiae bacterium]